LGIAPLSLLVVIIDKKTPLPGGVVWKAALVVTQLGQHNYPDAGSGFFTFFALGLLLMLRIMVLLRLIEMRAQGNKKPRQFGRGAGFLPICTRQAKTPELLVRVALLCLFLGCAIAEHAGYAFT
jgi:hypothetical protein